MTAFLDRLAAMARGEALEGAARVALPPRLLRSAPEGADGWPPVGAAPGAPATGTAAALPREPDPAPARPLAAGPDATAPGEAGRRMDAGPPPPPERQTAERRPERPKATDPVALPAPSEAASRAGSLPTATRLATPSGKAPHGLPTAFAPLQPAPPTESERRAAPLGPAMLAARPLRAREAPVVHVTIDRIEVRAPAPAAPAAPPPARRKPLPCGDSLSDFLRGKRP